jgi:hypothetical protein
MTQIAGRLHDVDAWGGVPGRPVSFEFALLLRAAGVPKVAKTAVDGSHRYASYDDDVGDPHGTMWLAPTVFHAIEDEVVAGLDWKSYTTAAIWAFKEFGMDGLDSMYRLFDQSTGTFADYIYKAWREATGR